MYNLGSITPLNLSISLTYNQCANNITTVPLWNIKGSLRGPWVYNDDFRINSGALSLTAAANTSASVNSTLNTNVTWDGSIQGTILIDNTYFGAVALYNTVDGLKGILICLF